MWVFREAWTGRGRAGSSPEQRVWLWARSRHRDRTHQGRTHRDRTHPDAGPAPGDPAPRRPAPKGKGIPRESSIPDSPDPWLRVSLPARAGGCPAFLGVRRFAPRRGRGRGGRHLRQVQPPERSGWRSAAEVRAGPAPPPVSPPPVSPPPVSPPPAPQPPPLPVPHEAPHPALRRCRPGSALRARSPACPRCVQPPRPPRTRDAGPRPPGTGAGWREARKRRKEETPCPGKGEAAFPLRAPRPGHRFSDSPRELPAAAGAGRGQKPVQRCERGRGVLGQLRSTCGLRLGSMG